MHNFGILYCVYLSTCLSASTTDDSKVLRRHDKPSRKDESRDSKISHTPIWYSCVSVVNQTV